MNHDAYESQMIDGVNRSADEKGDQPFTHDIPVAKPPVTKEKDIWILSRGIKRTVIALFTISTFALSVYGFISVAAASGYLAVARFLVSILATVVSGVLLYAQGITHKGKVIRK